MNHVARCCIRTLTRCALILGLLSPAIAAHGQSRLNVSLVGSNKPPQASSGFGDVWGEGNIACLGVWQSSAYNNLGVAIFDISNPVNPVLYTNYNPFPGSAANQFEQGVVRNRILYAASWGNAGGSGAGVHLVSLTNEASPVLLSRITASTPGTVMNGFNNVHTLFLERNFLYEAAHVTGTVSVKVFDVSNPHLPVYVRDVVTTNTTKVHQITVQTNQSGQVILFTSGWGGASTGNPASPGQTDIWDVTQVGTQPAQWLGRIHSGDNSHSSWPTADGNTLVVCRETAGGEVKLYDISNPGAITNGTPPLATITPAGMGLEPDIPHNPVVVGNHLFLSWYQNGLQIFDISDRSRPVRVGYYDTYPNGATASFQGNWGVDPQLGFHRVLLSDIQSGFYVLDASALLTPTNNYPPLILHSPASLNTTQGLNATFSTVATGSLLNYQWRRNGANLAGATGSALILTNVQPAQAGNYSVVVSNATYSVTSANASLSVGVVESSQTPFWETFDSASSSNDWDVFEGSGNGTPDYTVDWSFDYSSYFSVFNGATIPPAPATTNGTTRGVRLTVNNNDAVPSTAGVSLYPKNKSFSGAYKLKCDLWINYPGSASGAGSTGSTEHGLFGLNHAGTRVNWHSANPSDGVWFAVCGEGGTSAGDDYRAYAGNSSSTPTSLSVSAGGFAAAGAASRNNTDPYWQSLFPSPTFETAGVPGKKWVQVEIAQDTNNVLTWRMNGNLIAQRTNTSSFTNGNIMIGFMDVFTSIASPAADAFVLFDNVRVEIAGTAAPPAIVSAPADVSVYPEQDAQFTVAASGSGTLTYQWLFNGEVIPGATNNSYTRFNVQPEDAGFYSVTVANNIGSTTSSTALLSLLDSPYVSAVQATAGARSALVSWTTTVPGDSQVQFDPASLIPDAPAAAAMAQGGFGGVSYTDPMPTTNHVILLTGLEPGTRYSYQTLSTAASNTYVSGVYQFTTAGALILDNADAAYTGTWTEGTISTDKYSTNYLFASTVAGPATATATWRPRILTPGRYDISVWYPQGSNRATNAPYTINFHGGATNTTINQQSGGGGWRMLASGIELAAGTNGFVRLANNAGNNVVIADAVRFDYVEAQDFPTGAAIPLWWASFFFGNAADASLDGDGDAYTTAQEYVMGTNPTNAASHLEMAGDLGTNAVARVTFWPLLANRSYDLLYRTNLNGPIWQNNGGGAPVSTPTGGGYFNLGTTNEAQNYFRLKVQLTTNASGSSLRALPRGSSTLTSEAACGPFRVYVK